jgi:hypothetical protein
VTAISFKAAAPYAVAPVTQPITALVTGVSSGTLYATLVVDNPDNFFTVSSLTISGSSGAANVIPAMPSALHVGAFHGSITVTICLNDPTCHTGQLAGSPQVISVDYNIASGVDGDTVTPHAVAANAAGTVVLRGAGFTAATSVSFGSMPATSMSVASDSEIDASYPALPVGTYPVTINAGAIGFTAGLIAVSSPAFTATVIPYPSNVVPQPLSIEYDVQRSALFLVFKAGTYTNPTLVRYAFDGNAWGSPTQISVAGLVQVHMSPDGNHVLALVTPDATHTSLVELDPVTLAQTNVTTISNAQQQGGCGFAVANDGNAIVTFQLAYGYAFGTYSHVFTEMSDGGSCTVTASGNGNILTMNTATYIASSESVIHPGAEVGLGATADFAGDKFVFAEQVQSAGGQVLGTLSGVVGAAINAAGTRAYGPGADPVTCGPTLITFDLTAPGFPQLGTPIPLPLDGPPGTCLNTLPALVAVAPDGATVFIGGPNDLTVQPITP